MKAIYVIVAGAVLFSSCTSSKQTQSFQGENSYAKKNEAGQRILIEGKKHQLVLGNRRLVEKKNRKAEKVPKYEFDNKE
jgi:hypothetical protein